MKASTLEGKTIRPGLMHYSYYSSDRRPAQTTPVKPALTLKWRRGRLVSLVAAVLIVAGGTSYAIKPSTKTDAVKTPVATVTAKKATTTPTLKPTATATPAAAAATTTATNYCADNTLSQLIKVSISMRHMWVCQGTQTVYDSPDVSGIEYLAADKTPPGTYHIYGKYTDTVLKGSDTTGSWNDPVSYWMPFLHNQYGSYGFHDATWRSDSDFGNIDPNSADASHGCIELPLSTAAWLYNWAKIGTTVSIQA